jgi:hypothetical protein
VQPEGLGKFKKNSFTSSGLEAQRLNHYATADEITEL